MERDVIESVPALDGAHGAIERSVATQHALPVRELEDNSFEKLRPGCGVHESHDVGFTSFVRHNRLKSLAPLLSNAPFFRGLH